jgi:CPA1 family monovalent cation:H+ antiporter
MKREEVWPPWNESALVAWAGMRGGDSLVIALAIPFVTAGGRPFPGRALIVFVTFGVIFVTLVAQGLTLAPAVRWLGLDSTGENDELGEGIARRAIAEAALRHIEHVAPTIPPSQQRMLDRLRSLYTLRRDRWRAQAEGEQERAPASARVREADWNATAEAHEKLQIEIIDAERRTLGKLRTDTRVSEDVLLRLQRELDLERMLLESNEAGEDTLGASPYEVGDIDVE